MDNVNVQNDINYWDLFYEFYIPKATLKTIRNQAARLISVSKNLEAWARSNYGNVLSMVSSDTLRSLRQCWLQYFDPRNSNQESREAFHFSATSAHNHQVQRKDLVNLRPLFGPLVSKSTKVAEFHAMVSCDFGCECENIPDTECVNPLFTFSIGSGTEFSVRARSHALMGFHLAASLAPLTPGSIWGQLNRIEVDVLKVKALAFLQFERWCASFKQFVQESKSSASGSKLYLRFFVGDALAFCYGLSQLRTQVTSNVVACYAQPWSGNSLDLNGDCYSDISQNRAPLSFNVVEASDLVDTVGIFNLLVSVIPILEQSPSTILYSDSTFFPEKDQTESCMLSRLLYGDARTICALMGFAPVPFLSGVSIRAFQQDVSRPSTNRIAWKFPSSGDMAVGISGTKISCDPKELGTLLAEMYFKMLPFESYDFAPVKDEEPQQGFGSICNPPHYTRCGFAALMAFLKPRVYVDWDAMMICFYDSITSLCQDCGYMHLQDLCLQLYLLGTEPHIRKFQITRTPPGYVIPSASLSCVILTVPRCRLESLLRRYSAAEKRLNRRLNLSFQIRLVAGPFTDGQLMSERLNATQCFSSPLAIFGKLTSLADGKNCTVEYDPNGWRGSSDLHVCTYVPTHSVEFIQTALEPEVALQITLEQGSVYALLGLPPHKLDVFSALLNDKNFVHIVPSFPGLDTPRPTRLSSPDTTLSVSNEFVDITIPLLNISRSTFTSRLTFRREQDKQLLRSGISVIVKDSTPCTVDVASDAFEYRFVFPFPIAARRAKVQLNRRLGWIQIIVPLASGNDGGYNANPFPVIKGRNEGPYNWNAPFILFKILPKIDLNRTNALGWIMKHIDTMLSNRERQLLESNSQDTISEITLFKKSLIDIFLALTRSAKRTFEIKSDHNAPPSIIFQVNDLFLLDTAHSIVAEAQLLSSVKAAAAFEGSINIVVGEPVVKLWKEVLPSMVERCRGGEYSSGCTYSVDSERIGQGESSTCVREILQHSNDLINATARNWREFSGTRIAISPVFAVPYVEDCGNDDVVQRAGSVDHNFENGENFDALCNRCRSQAVKLCGRCKVVKYCSRECQSQDWKEHKKICGRRIAGR